MNIYDLNFFEQNLDKFVNQAKEWKIFIYPTDTIYGIGAIVSTQTVQKIYNIKKRNLCKPLSIIAPNISWIEQNFQVPADFKDFLTKFLNQYHWITLVLKKQDKNFLSELGDIESLGIRILKNDFQSFVAKLWEAFISTSVNISWKTSIKSIKHLDEAMKPQIDIFVDGGILDNPPSVLIDIYQNNINKRA